MRKSESTEIWNREWESLTPESEIKMWDFYGLRQWILKYAPRYGTILEAGCGLGRYVFYLNEVGINCMGLDFSEEAMAKIQICQKENNFMAKFCRGNVESLPFKDNSVSGYISLGVVEHFEEGPIKALREAYRILCPGGIAIITTPSLSFSQIYLKATTKVKMAIKDCVKKIIKYPIHKPNFFQYWYTPKTLKNFVQNAGLKVAIAKGADLLYSCYELGYIPKRETWFNRLLSKLENTFIANIGAQSITISYKPASKMRCFLCGSLNVKENEMITAIPICNKCLKEPYAKYYVKSERPQLQFSYIINPANIIGNNAVCEYCGKTYQFHRIFEYYGFAKKVCPACLKDPHINIELSENYIQPIWRRRGKV